MILAIDPGPTTSGVVWWDHETGYVLAVDPTFENERLRVELRDPRAFMYRLSGLALAGLESIEGAHVVIEQVESFGMAVGVDVFETVWWAGRFFEAWITPGVRHRHEPRRMPRRTVKLALCGTSQAKDTNIRQALLDRYCEGSERLARGIAGKRATRNKPAVEAVIGRFAGVASHAWSAVALAVVYGDELRDGRPAVVPRAPTSRRARKAAADAEIPPAFTESGVRTW